MGNRSSTGHGNTYVSDDPASSRDESGAFNFFTMCTKLSSEAYRLIFSFCDASPLMMIQSTIFFRMYFKLNVLTFGPSASGADELPFDKCF